MAEIMNYGEASIIWDDDVRRLTSRSKTLIAHGTLYGHKDGDKRGKQHRQYREYRFTVVHDPNGLERADPAKSHGPTIKTKVTSFRVQSGRLGPHSRWLQNLQPRQLPELRKFIVEEFHRTFLDPSRQLPEEFKEQI